MYFEKNAHNILVTDITKIEWLASQFIRDCRIQSGVSSFVKDIRWINPPKWAAERYNPISLNCCGYELERQKLNLYSFPGSIGRNFQLDDLDIEFEGVLLIVDLGAKLFWESQINHEKRDKGVEDQFPESKALVKRDPHIKHQFTPEEIDNIFIHRVSAFGDPKRIWGIELVNQIKGTKLILAVKSSPDCVPVSHIRKYLHLESAIDILEHTVDPDTWSHQNPSYSSKIIRDTLSMLSQKVYRS